MADNQSYNNVILQLFLQGNPMRASVLIILLAISTAFVGCGKTVAPDRCITVDAGESRYVSSPKFEICLPDKTVYRPPQMERNTIEFVNAYEGNWLPSGVYEVGVYRDDVLIPQSVEQNQHDLVNMMGMREIQTKSRKLYYKRKNRILNTLPEEEKKQAFGISVAVAENNQSMIFIEAAILKPKGYENDPIGTMDALVKDKINTLVDHIKIASQVKNNK